MPAERVHPPEPEAEEYSFYKDKLPKPLSYPLKRSLLDAALQSHSVYRAVWYVVYSRRRFNKVILQAHFYPEDKMHGFGSGKVQLTVHAVSASERKAAEDMLVGRGLPALCRWLAKVESEGDAWRSFRHSLTIEQIDDGLKFSEE